MPGTGAKLSYDTSRRPTDRVDERERQKEQHGASLPEAPARPSNGGRRQSSRRAIPIVMNEAATVNPLSPVLRSLQLPNMSTLRSYLPVLPAGLQTSTAGPAMAATVDQQRDRVTCCSWQTAQLPGSPVKQLLLLVSTTRHVLRIYHQEPGRIPDDPHAIEEVPPAEEIFSLGTIPPFDPASSRGTGVNVKRDEQTAPEETVVSARVIHEGGLADDRGPVVLLLTSRASSRRTKAALSLSVIELTRGALVKRILVGHGPLAEMQCSARGVAIATALPSPRLLILHPGTLEPIGPPIIPTYSLSSPFPPIFALSGRLLAYATDEPPRSTGPDGLGTLVSAKHTSRSRVTSEGVQPRPTSAAASDATSTSSALMSSAIGITGVVAKGVWAGIKTGAKAASDARASRLARSAPADTSVGGMADGVLGDDLSNSHSLAADSSLLENDMTGEVVGVGSGRWIKIIDLGRLPRERPPTSPYEITGRQLGDDPTLGAKQAVTIAHFRLPPVRSILPNSPSDATRAQSVPGGGTGYLKWNHDGTQLFVAPQDGRVFHVFQLHPARPARGGRQDQPRGEVLHLYELRRGNTAARVQAVEWDTRGRWIGVNTERGTTHIYPLHPAGAPASASSHASLRIINPSQIYPLSQAVDSAIRFRPPGSLQDPSRPRTVDRSPCPPALAFGAWQAHPLEPDTLCQDIHLFAPDAGVIEAHRLSVGKTGSDRSPPSVKGSGLTQMMRLGSGSAGPEDAIRVTRAVKGRWLLPDLDEDLHLGVMPAGPAVPKRTVPPLAYAEIRTHSSNPRILPPSIYLSHQVDFFAAKPIDDYSPQSIADPEARQRRLRYRPDIQVRPGAQGVRPISFNEPLSTALQSRIETPSHGEIPGLPNGTPDSGGKWTSHLPIRTVASGVNEGIDHVRQHYAKAQTIKRHRRASEILANGLSFDEDTIFASSPTPALVEGGESSSSGSGGLAPSDRGVSPNGVGVQVETSSEDTEWGDQWEEEYRRAVDLDGEPDDLICGLMDEEEEERRRLRQMQARAAGKPVDRKSGRLKG